MEQTVRDNLSRLSKLGMELPLSLWLPMAVDAVRALVPTDSGLLKELGTLQSESGAANKDSDTGAGAVHSSRDAKVHQYVSSILNNIDTLVYLYEPHVSGEMETATQTLRREQVVLEECKQALTREIESARQTLGREVDFAIAERLFKHWAFRIVGALLLALVLGFIGINMLFSQKVAAAQQQVAKMQGQANEAQLAIYTKASELNKSLDTAREDLSKSRDAAADILKNDQDNARKEIDSVKGAMTDLVKKEGSNGVDMIKKEEDVQIERLRTVTTQKLAHTDKPWAVWLLSSWAPSGLAILLSIVSIVAMWSRNRR
jgi:hypothetical protein